MERNWLIMSAFILKCYMKAFGHKNILWQNYRCFSFECPPASFLPPPSYSLTLFSKVCTPATETLANQSSSLPPPCTVIIASYHQPVLPWNKSLHSPYSEQLAFATQVEGGLLPQDGFIWAWSLSGILNLEQISKRERQNWFISVMASWQNHPLVPVI